MQYAWPGNVRELQHAIERAVILSDNRQILHAENFMLKPPHTERKIENDNLNLGQIEKNTIEKALKRSNGNISRAAQLLGITRYSLYRKLEKDNDTTQL